MFLLGPKPYDGSKARVLTMICKAPHNPTPLILLSVLSLSPSANPHKSNRSLHLNQAVMLLPHSSVFLSLCIEEFLHVANSLTYSRSLLKYHLSNNESIPVYSIIICNCLLCIFSLLCFSFLHSTYHHLSYDIFSLFISFIVTFFPTVPLECKSHKRRNLSVSFTNVSTINEYNQQEEIFKYSSYIS